MQYETLKSVMQFKTFISYNYVKKNFPVYNSV